MVVDAVLVVILERRRVVVGTTRRRFFGGRRLVVIVGTVLVVIHGRLVVAGSRTAVLIMPTAGSFEHVSPVGPVRRVLLPRSDAGNNRRDLRARQGAIELLAVRNHLGSGDSTVHDREDLLIRGDREELHGVERWRVDPLPDRSVT